jgi:hypothetical protein
VRGCEKESEGAQKKERFQGKWFHRENIGILGRLG